LPQGGRDKTRALAGTVVTTLHARAAAERKRLGVRDLCVAQPLKRKPLREVTNGESSGESTSGVDESYAPKRSRTSSSAWGKNFPVFFSVTVSEAECPEPFILLKIPGQGAATITTTPRSDTCLLCAKDQARVCRKSNKCFPCTRRWRGNQLASKTSDGKVVTLTKETSSGQSTKESTRLG